MPDVTIGARLEADAGGAINSVRNFKQELRLAQEEVITLSEKFGATSREAAEAAKRAEDLKGAIDDARELVQAFDPDARFQAFGRAINTVVGGFTALQGVMGLVGAESEETQKALLKVQSALAISQGFQQLQEGVKIFQNLGTVIKSTTVFQKANAAATAVTSTVMKAFGVNVATTSTAFNVLKGAIIATGIGALVVGLTVAIQALDSFTDSTEDAAEAQEKLKTQIEAANSALQGTLDFFTNEEKLDIARAKRRGASEEEIFQIQQRYRRLNFNATKSAHAEIANLDKEQGEKLLKQLNDINTAGQVAQLEFETRQLEQQRQAAEKAAQLTKEIRQKQLKEAEEELKRQAELFKARGGPAAGLNIQVPKSPEQIQIENTLAAAKVAADERDRLRQAERDAEAARLNEIRDNAINQALIEEQLYQTRKTLLTSTGDLFSALGALIGKETAAGKVLGIAQATINTFIGATEVLRAKSVLPEPFGTINKIANVAAVIATGLSAVKNIVKTPVPGAAGGSVAVPAPLQPQRPTQLSTTLDQQSLNAIGNATTRAFVVESDVSNNQERVRRLNRASRIG